MPAISNLPPLKAENDGIPPPDTAGVWVRRSGSSLLRKIAEALDHKDEGTADAADGPIDDSTAIASVPDVWAQAEVFRSDLIYDGKDRTRAARKSRAVAEWRGLLALLALKDRHAYSLETLPLDFTTTGTVDTEGAAQHADAAGMFMAVCGRLLPRGVAFKDHSWRNIAILKVSGQTVALLAPTTLVVPARDYEVRLAAAAQYIPWFRKGLLEDPTQANIGLRPRDYLILGAFLREVLNNVRATPAEQDEVHNALIGLLTSFEADSRRLGMQAGLPETAVRRTSSLGLNLPVGQTIYGPLNNVFRTAAGAEHQTRVQPRGTAPNQFRGVLLHDSQNGFRQLGAAAAKLVLWGDLTQERAMEDRAALQRAEGEAQSQGFLLLDVAKLFLPRIIEIKDPGRAVDHGNLLENFVLPLSPIVLMLFNPDDLRHAVRVEKIGKDIRVALSVTLVDQAGQPSRTYAAERIYRHERKEIENRAVPVACSVWPDFHTENWRYYTAFHRGQPDTDICVTSALSPEAVLQSLPADASPEQTVAVIASWARGEAISIKQVPIARTSSNVSDLFVSTSPIEALACGIKQRAPADARPETLGFVLTRTTPIVPASNSKAVIGIDFGTSNTCIYLKVGAHGTPVEARFRNRQLLPLVQHGAGAQPKIDPIAFSDFMPFTDVSMPFLSLLQMREGMAGTVDENLPFGRSHLWFVWDLQESMSKALADDRYLYFNLKWSKVAEDRGRLRGLLRDAALLALAEATQRGVNPKDVEWAFSYPLTQTFNEKEYRQSCQIAVDAALEAASGRRQSAKLVDEITESEAAALYFRGQELAAFSGTTVTIDIGGGTSDISIWDGVEQVWRHSLELAGRRILLSYLRRRMQFFEALCQDAGKGGALSSIGKTTGAADVQNLLKTPLKAGANKDASDPIVKMLEVVINSPEFREQFPRRLADLSGETDGATLKWLATLALAGMVYFVGRQMAAMKDRVTISTAQGVTFCLSGRGSTLYSNLFSDKRELKQRLAFVFYKAAGCADTVPVEIVFSQDPKHEAAFGLVSDWEQKGDRPTLTLMGPKRLDSPIVGESIITNKGVLPATALATETTGMTSLKVEELRELEAFLKILSEMTAKSSARVRPDGVRVDISKHRTTLLRQINQELASWVASAEDAKPSVKEPIFLVALRLMVDLVNDRELKLEPVEQ